MDEIRVSSFIAMNYVALPDTLKQKIVKELTLDNPEYSRMLHLSKPFVHISEYQTLYQVTTDKKTHQKWLILPRGFLPTLIQLYKEAERPFQLIDQRLTLPEVSFDSKIVPRDYQKPAIEKAIIAKSGIIQAPCGSGKTMIGLEIIARAGQPALWLVHTKELLEQAVDRIQEYLQIPKAAIGIIEDNRQKIGGEITVGMVQSLERKVDLKLANRFGLVVLDEAHHAPAKTFSRVVSAFPALYRIGLTATPYRRDGMHPLMYYTIGYTIHKITHVDLTQSGELILPNVELIPTEFSFRYNDDYPKLIKVLTENEGRNRLILQKVAEEAKAGHYCLVLSERIAHCELLHKEFEQETPEVKSAVLVGELNQSEQQRVMNELRNRELNVVFATKVADEGLDIAHLDRLFIATPYRSAHKVKQQVGRIMRPAEDKSDAIVYDFVDEKIPVLKNQMEIRKEIYDSFMELESVETPLDFDALENLFIKEEAPSTVKKERSNKPKRPRRQRSQKRSRREYRIECDGCGKSIVVPFSPDGRRPVYCDECFEFRKSTTLGRALQQAFSKQSSPRRRR
ncbi:TPA: DEAD/DEAH box helicase [Candidatus Poribacteria bacterium]|nr:DEAD/DEAH box helicase [Candidatus Poribacteria bacterium]